MTDQIPSSDRTQQSAEHEPAREPIDDRRPDGPPIDAADLEALEAFESQLRQFPLDTADLDGAAECLHGEGLGKLLSHYCSLRIPDASETLSFVPAERTAGDGLPTEIGPYRLLRPLGRGGMGIVFLAEHQMLGTQRAIKLISPELASSDAAVQRFRSEIRAHGRAESIHPAFAPALEAHEIDGLLYLVTEAVAGTDLDHLIRHTGPLPVPIACELMRQVADAIAAAHQRGLVHRDLKPSNLMLTPEGTVRVLDLGLALLTTEVAGADDLPSKEHHSIGNEAQESQHGAAEDTARAAAFETPGRRSAARLVGTPEFMAPEQFEAPDQVETSCDIYSLGATLFALLTGRSPLNVERQASRAVKIETLAHRNVLNISHLRPELPSGLETLIHSLLHADPSKRPALAVQVAEVLAQYSSTGQVTELLARLPIAQPGCDWPDREELAKHFQQEVESGRAREQFQTTRRNRTRLVGMLFLLAAVAAGWSFIASSPDSRSAPLAPQSESPETARNTSETATAAVPEPAPVIPDEPVEEPVLVLPTIPWTADEFRAASRSYEPLPEPLSLEEWLVGKKIVTVKQDGTADYSNIAAACRSRQPGEVVEVLDVGPYIENLQIMPMHPGSGLFSRVGTVIIPAQLTRVERGPKNKNGDFNIHSIGECPDFRLSGLNFHCESVSRLCPFSIFTNDEFTLEKCSFIQCGDVAQKDGNRPPAIRVFETLNPPCNSRLVIRDCIFSPMLLLNFNSYPDVERSVLLTRNLFRSEDSHWRLSIKLESPEPPGCRYVIQKNVFDRAKRGRAIILSSTGGFPPAELVFTENTLRNVGAYNLCDLGNPTGAASMPRLHWLQNLVAAQPTSWLNSGFPEPPRFQFNLVPVERPDSGEAQLINRVVLPDDAERADYLRIHAASPLGKALKTVGSDCIPGALPLDEPGRAEDWFDRLRKRWGEQTKLNKELEDQLRAVPRI